MVKTILHSPNGGKKHQTYTSHEIENEMLKDKSLSILHDAVLEAIKSSDYHRIMVDES